MATASTHEVTQLLLAWREGDEAALESLIPVLYQELRRLAHRYMLGSVPGTPCKRPRWSMRPICGW